MKRPSAVLLIVCLLGGCRGSQPTTNPFLRTTVPPPTSPGVVVTPGQPYAAGISPPMVTTPAPSAPIVTTPAPVTPAPMTPAPAPAPLVAPPPIAPQGDQFKPPGGNFLFHQSSNQPSAAEIEASAPQLAAATVPPSRVVQVAYSPPQNVSGTPTAQTAGHIYNPYVQSGVSNKVAEITPQVSRGDPPETTAKVTLSEPAPQANTIRIIGPSSPATASPATPPASSAAPISIPAFTPAVPVIRLTVGDPQPALKSTLQGEFLPASPGGVTNSNSTSNTAQFVVPQQRVGAADSGVVQAGFQPAGGATSDYAHSADYTMLRGKLEYSHASREWKLRYIPIDGQTDDFGGSVVLENSPLLAGYKPGEMVAARGVVAGKRASGYAPRYTLTALERTSR